MVAVFTRQRRKMADPDADTSRPTSGYKLYRDTMEKLVEIARHRKQTLADLCEPVLASLADAEYLAMLNEKMEAEKERRRVIAELQKKKRAGS